METELTVPEIQKRIIIIGSPIEGDGPKLEKIQELADKHGATIEIQETPEGETPGITCCHVYGFEIESEPEPMPVRRGLGRIGFLSSALALTGMMEMTMCPRMDTPIIINEPSRGKHSRYARSFDPPTHPKVGRNEPCSCGSGIKYKHCHGK